MQKSLVREPTHSLGRFFGRLRPAKHQRHQPRLLHGLAAISQRETTLQGTEKSLCDLKPCPVRPRHLVKAVKHQQERLRIVLQPRDRTVIEHHVIGGRQIAVVGDDLINGPIDLHPL